MEFENSNLNASMVSQAYTEGPTSKVHEGVTRSTTGGGSETVAAITHSSLDEQKGATTVLGTARNNAGSPTTLRTSSVTVELEPGNPSSRTNIDTAVKLGYLVKTASGDYVEADRQGATQETEGSNQEQPQGPELFDPTFEASFNEHIADVPQPIYDQALIKAATQVAETGDISDFAEAMASTTGIDVQQLRKAQEIGLANFQAQADGAIQKLGVNPQELYQWARENQKEALGKAVRAQVSTRSLDGYRKLANEYLNKVAPSAEVLQKHGYETKPGPKGEGPLVRIQGLWMSVKAAARSGFI